MTVDLQELIAKIEIIKDFTAVARKLEEELEYKVLDNIKVIKNLKESKDEFPQKDDVIDSEVQELVNQLEIYYLEIDKLLAEIQESSDGRYQALLKDQRERCTKRLTEPRNSFKGGPQGVKRETVEN